MFRSQTDEAEETYRNRDGLVLHEQSDGPGGHSGVACPGNQ